MTRLQKFKKQAPHINGVNLLRKILATFPEDERSAVYDSIKADLPPNVRTDHENNTVTTITAKPELIV